MAATAAKAEALADALAGATVGDALASAPVAASPDTAQEIAATALSDVLTPDDLMAAAVKSGAVAAMPALESALAPSANGAENDDCNTDGASADENDNDADDEDLWSTIYGVCDFPSWAGADFPPGTLYITFGGGPAGGIALLASGVLLKVKRSWFETATTEPISSDVKLIFRHRKGYEQPELRLVPLHFADEESAPEMECSDCLERGTHRSNDESADCGLDESENADSVDELVAMLADIVKSMPSADIPSLPCSSADAAKFLDRLRMDFIERCVDDE